METASYLQEIATRNKGRVAKVYNDKLGYGIVQTSRGFEIYNEFGYAGARATLEKAVAEYDRMETGNAAFCHAHGC